MSSTGDSSAVRAADRFLEYYHRVRQIHKQDTGQEFVEYKPTEPDRLVVVFRRLLQSDERSLDLLAQTLHLLVWSQCLGNANHRTTILLLQGTLKENLGLDLPYYTGEADAMQQFMVAVEDFSDRSHRLLDQQSEFGYNPAQLERRHLELSRRWIEKQLGPQSLVDTTIEPHLLITASS